MAVWELRVSARRRSLSVEVHPDLRVIVRAPRHLSRSVVEDWVASRSCWIEHQLERFRLQGHRRPPPPAYASGERHLFLGRSCVLEVLAAARPAVTLDGETLRIAVRGEAGGATVRRALERWYRERAAEVFDEALRRHFGWFAARGHRPPIIRIRSMVSRWGSLSAPAARVGAAVAAPAPRRMSLNLALIRTPLECIEYVVVHELCHLEERGHGAGFYQLMDQRLPGWRARRRQLEAARLLG
ncbi:MAG: M48 family metallopeptidase [Gammaproteobacteria bacterium]|nr:M48 family metallopeptidase [Gammaproteobacteria bacterium]